MDYENLKNKLQGCYVTVPTPFKDTKNLPLNFDALKDYVEFLFHRRIYYTSCERSISLGPCLQGMGAPKAWAWEQNR